MVDTSQYGEAGFIAAHFDGRRTPGRFLDIGAFDGRTNSTTSGLAQEGWSGVCVEPNPPAFCALMRRYEDNPRITLVNAAVMPYAADQTGLTEFHANTADGYSADMMSTFSAAHKAKFDGHPYRSIMIPHVSGASLYASVGAVDHPFDFVSIDVEGLNVEVFHEIPTLPEMLCIELDPHSEVERLVKVHYPYARIIGGNIIGWRLSK